MRKTTKLFFLIFALWIPASAFPAHALNSVTVMADSSMSVAIAQIARRYSRHNPVAVNTSFVAQSAQEAQITDGSAADILITTKQGWIDQLKTRGLIDIYSQTPVAKNQLALVGAADSKLQLSLAQKFNAERLIAYTDKQLVFVVGNPEALPEGIYAKEALHNFGVAAELAPYTQNVNLSSQLVDMVAQHGAYGLFFYSTTFTHSGLRVIDVIPESFYTPIVYYAVVIAGDNMDEARKFLEFLKSDDAKDAFKRNGFTID